MTPDEAGLLLLDGAIRADVKRYNEVCGVLSQQPTLTRVEHPAFAPFWVVARYDDVTRVEMNARLFQNAPNPVLSSLVEDRALEATGGAPAIRSLIHMDDPEHREYRKVTLDWFQARKLDRYRAPLEKLASAYLDRMREAGGSCDFADIAMNFPLNGILAIMGLPESDHQTMLRLTQEFLAPQDPDVSALLEDAQPQAPSALDMEAMMQIFTYFSGITEDRRKHPTGDLASTIANAEVKGCPMNELETASYYALFAVAGHDTTAATIAGGLRALIEHPEQLKMLKDDPALMPAAVEEMIRWVTPVKYFMRTVSADTEVGGTPLKRGDRLMLLFAAANRDEAKFPDPDQFNIRRDFTRHLAFGMGTHFCLGAPFARMEVGIFFRELVRQVDAIELAGEYTERQTISPVAGCKHMPIRYSFVTADSPR
jgi:cytochrome P450